MKTLPGNQQVFNFGKYKEKPVAEVLARDTSYYDWMMKGDFAAETKKVLTALRLQWMNEKNR